jgi:hypothetical protein
MVESGCVVVFVLVLSGLFGSDVGCGVSQAPITSTDTTPRTINNFFIDYYLQITELLTGVIVQFFCHRTG